MKKIIVSKTGRESLLFHNLVYVANLINKFLNLHNYFFRKTRIKNHLRNNPAVKVQFGCGDNYLSGFLNTDLFGRMPVDITKKLPFADDSIDLLYSNHVVEHVYSREFKKFLKESHRVLKKGGSHIIATPCLEYLFTIFYGGGG